MIVLELIVVALAVWATAAVRRRYFPAPVAWTRDEEEAAEVIAMAWHVTLEEARLAVLAWRDA